MRTILQAKLEAGRVRGDVNLTRLQAAHIIAEERTIGEVPRLVSAMRLAVRFATDHEEPFTRAEMAELLEDLCLLSDLLDIEPLSLDSKTERNEYGGATMKTTSIVARLREENAELRADNISLQADNLAMLDAIVKQRVTIMELRAELQAIKNPGEHAEAG